METQKHITRVLSIALMLAVCTPMYAATPGRIALYKKCIAKRCNADEKAIVRSDLKKAGAGAGAILLAAAAAIGVKRYLSTSKTEGVAALAGEYGDRILSEEEVIARYENLETQVEKMINDRWSRMFVKVDAKYKEEGFPLGTEQKEALEFAMAFGQKYASIRTRFNETFNVDKIRTGLGLIQNERDWSRKKSEIMNALEQSWNQLEKQYLSEVQNHIEKAKKTGSLF